MISKIARALATKQSPQHALEQPAAALDTRRAPSQPAKPKYVRSPEFMPPAKLRARVGFWVDVFSKYGKYQVLVHHLAFSTSRLSSS